ncbi:hypothetical protein COR50_00290 [Chitinophaga caeni]|uniref:Uncharacterized protein n=1 Tax=Chitinophaga caeni TaxID=2029983 RepID=A0A291QP63_9BACT|nr:hypothetical protein COR50_00290 [Chitinophaga caeni]
MKIKMLNKIISKYIFVVSILMSIYVILFFISFNWDIDVYGFFERSFNIPYNYISKIVFYIFMFCYLNVPLIVVVGIYALFWEKKYKLSLWCILISSMYLLYVLSIGNEI